MKTCTEQEHLHSVCVRVCVYTHESFTSKGLELKLPAIFQLNPFLRNMYIHSTLHLVHNLQLGRT